MSLAVPALPVTGGITTLSGRSTRQPSRRAVVAAASARGEQGMGPRRVVALHGKGGDGERMLAGLQPLVEAAGAEMEWVCPTAPHAVRGGHAWWLTAPGERSFEALEWEGIEKSIAAVEALYPFDALLGYSQVRLVALVSFDGKFWLVTRQRCFASGRCRALCWPPCLPQGARRGWAPATSRQSSAPPPGRSHSTSC